MRQLLRRIGVLAAFVFVCLIPFALLEGALGLARIGDSNALFLPAEGDPDSLALNPHFADVYFPPGLARPLKPAYLRREKREDGVRVFVLGASAAAGFPDHTTGFSRTLRVLLRRGFPDLDWEVVNLATAAINSHVVYDIAKRAARFEPDVFLVYLGNNEVIGPFGPTGRMTLSLGNVRVVRALSALRRLRLARFATSLRGEAGAPTEWQGMRAFVDHPISRSDPRLADVHASFQRNLEDIRDVALGAGARVVFSAVPSNLADFGPFASSHGTDLSDAERDRWDVLFRRGREALETGDPLAAISDLRAAEEIDASHAGLHFALGSAFRAAGRAIPAREHLALARDLDTLRFRADSEINTIIERVARPDPSGRVGYVDPTSLAADGIPGFDLFLEHVHFSTEGNERLARFFFDVVAGLLAEDRNLSPREPPGDLPSLADAIFDVPPLRARALRALARMISQPPFAARNDNARLAESLAARIERIPADPEPLSDARFDALRDDPDDVQSHRKAFGYLKERLQAAAEAGNAPQARRLRSSLGALLAIRGDNDALNAQRVAWRSALEAEPKR